MTAPSAAPAEVRGELDTTAPSAAPSEVLGELGGAAPSTAATEFLGELGGTALLITFGLMAEAQVATTPNGSLGGAATIAFVWGVGVLAACSLFGPISGAHINPAVTVALATVGRFPFRKVWYYVVAQLLGGFLAAALVRAVTIPLIERFDPGLSIRSQAVFSTLPGVGVPLIGAFFNEVLGTFVLLVVLLGLLARAEHSKLLADLEPLLIGLTVMGIGLSMGSLSGWAINPARDLPPRLLQFWTGYAGAWSDQTGAPYWWVPVLGPLVGGVLGAVAFHWYPSLVRWFRSVVSPDSWDRVVVVLQAVQSAVVSARTRRAGPTTAAHKEAAHKEAEELTISAGNPPRGGQ